MEGILHSGPTGRWLRAKDGAGGRTRTGDLVVINDNPILRPVENAEGWTSDVIERRHSMPGIEPGPPRLSPRTVRPPYLVADNRSTSAHRNWGDQPDSHRHK